MTKETKETIEVEWEWQGLYNLAIGAERPELFDAIINKLAAEIPEDDPWGQYLIHVIADLKESMKRTEREREKARKIHSLALALREDLDRDLENFLDEAEEIVW